MPLPPSLMTHLNPRSSLKTENLPDSSAHVHIIIVSTSGVLYQPLATTWSLLHCLCILSVPTSSPQRVTSTSLLLRSTYRSGSRIPGQTPLGP